VLELRGISKTFGPVRALDDVSVRFAPGEIHALVGENGAGKSTAIKILCGIYQPDRGEVYYDDRRLRLRHYGESLAHGINLVCQEIQVIPESSVAENIMLDKMVTLGGTGIINWKAVNETARRYMALVGLALSPLTPAKFLSAAQKQLVQIAKALAAKPRVLILDEPTSALTEHEAANLFRILGNLRREDLTILFVSHKFEEVFALCDRVTILRDGRCVGTRAIKDLTVPDLVRMMIGRSFTAERLGRLDVDRRTEVLRVEHLERRNRVRDVSFTLYEGEILGFYGLVGSGRSETARLIIGADRMDGGEVFIRGRRAAIRHVADALRRYRIGYVTENRKEEGLLLQASLQTNLTITVWHDIINRLTRRINWQKEVSLSRRLVQSMSIKTSGLGQRVEELSGGNQQKVSIGKWLAAHCDVLLIDEPTIGVDIGAKEQIHRLIWNLAKQDRKSIILISSDMPEIVRLANRILVFRDQRIVGEITGLDDESMTYDQASLAIGHLLA